MPLLRSLLAGAAFAAALPALAVPYAAVLPEPGAVLSSDFHAASLAPVGLVALPPFEAKRAAPHGDDRGRLRVGEVRALGKTAAVAGWTRVGGGWVSRFTLASAGAEGLRARIDLGAVPGVMELRAQGTDGTVVAMHLDPYDGPVAWTPWTEGATQLVEIFSAVRPTDGEVRVGAVLHMDLAPTAKAAGSCTVPTRCSTGTPALDTAIAETRKALVRLSFVDGNSAFLCSGTLLNTERFPTPFIATAHHCLNNADAARTLTTLWFYENVACDINSPSSSTQVGGGSSIVFANYNVDSSVVQLSASPPPGAVFAATNRTRLNTAESVVSLSHPSGDTARLALGTVARELRFDDAPQDFYAIAFQRGIIEHGSSGSGLFTLAGTGLQFRGVLSGTTIRNAPGGMSCTNLDELAAYGRHEILAYQIDPFVKATATPADDAPNRAQDLFFAANDTPLDRQPAGTTRPGLRIDYAGDLDVFKFNLAAPAVVSAWSEGANLDTVGSILDSRGVKVAANDDAQASSNHFGVTAPLGPGTYYVQVGHWDATGTGAYDLRLKADLVEATNYTDLWGTGAENGWGLNINHQGNTVFATLFTYDATGAPLWLVMSNGDRQADGSYAGPLLRGTGSPYNAAGPYRAASFATVGAMRFTPTGGANARLTYTYNGATVTKEVTRFRYSTSVTCGWSAFDRSFASNVQDLWYVPTEPGWGLNLSHQGSILFATLFTYDESGRDLWLVMSNGSASSTTPGRFSGPLYRTGGAVFDASPWVAPTVTPIGTMTLDFTDGANGTLTYTYNGAQVTKSIQRFVFGTVKPECES